MPSIRVFVDPTYNQLDNHTTREERWKNDRFTALREIFEECNKNFGKIVIPEDFLSVDETLCHFAQ